MEKTEDVLKMMRNARESRGRGLEAEAEFHKQAVVFAEQGFSLEEIEQGLSGVMQAVQGARYNLMNEQASLPMIPVPGR